MIRNNRVPKCRTFNFPRQNDNQADMRSTRNLIFARGSESRLSLGILVALIGLCVACVQPTNLGAQTAHFSGAVVTLGSGF
jgi:hypothetical protein